MNLHMKSIRLLSVMLCWFLTIPVDSLSISVYYWHFSSLLVNFRQFSSIFVTSRHFSPLLITSHHFSSLLATSRLVLSLQFILIFQTFQQQKNTFQWKILSFSRNLPFLRYVFHCFDGLSSQPCDQWEAQLT